MYAALVPARPAHAIEVMAWAIEWQEELSAEALTAMREVYRASSSLRQELPSERDIPAFRFELGAGAEATPGVAATAGNVDYAKFDTDGGLEWSIGLRNQFISCNCGNYDRWASSKVKAFSLLSPFVDFVLSTGNRIKVVGLQYQDAWYSPQKVTIESIRQVLSIPSKWLPQAVLEHESLWHVHQGWLSESPTGARLLNVVNVDLLQEPTRSALRIDGQHRSHVSITRDGEVRDSQITFLGAIIEWEQLHIENRRMLDQLLTDEMLIQINAEKGKY